MGISSADRVASWQIGATQPMSNKMSNTSAFRILLAACMAWSLLVVFTGCHNGCCWRPFGCGASQCPVAACPVYDAQPTTWYRWCDDWDTSPTYWKVPDGQMIIRKDCTHPNCAGACTCQCQVADDAAAPAPAAPMPQPEKGANP
jgi:hypothetical protein